MLIDPSHSKVKSNQSRNLPCPMVPSSSQHGPLAMTAPPTGITMLQLPRSRSPTIPASEPSTITAFVPTSTPTSTLNPPAMGIPPTRTWCASCRTASSTWWYHSTWSIYEPSIIVIRTRLRSQVYREPLDLYSAISIAFSGSGKPQRALKANDILFGTSLLNFKSIKQPAHTRTPPIMHA